MLTYQSGCISVYIKCINQASCSMEKKKRTKKSKKLSRFASSFSMRFDAFTLDMLDRISWDEDKTRPEVIRAAIKLLYLKKHNQEELEGLRKRHRGSVDDISREEENLQ